MNTMKRDIPETLTGFKKEIETVQKVINDYKSGQKFNSAIISEPLAGRTAFINEIEKIIPSEVIKLSFSSIIDNKAVFMLPEKSKRIVIIDNCQFLYTRRIGGFAILNHPQQ